MKQFQIWTPVRIDARPFKDSRMGQYDRNTNTISMSVEITNRSFNNLDIALAMVHEISHSEDFSRKFHSYDASEIFAFVAQQRMLKKWLRAGTIDEREYDYRMASLRRDTTNYSEYVQQVVARAETMHLAAAFMPDMHAHVSMFHDMYSSKTRPFFNGLWGLELNPKGPLVAPAKP